MRRNKKWETQIKKRKIIVHILMIVYVSKGKSCKVDDQKGLGKGEKWGRII